MPLEGPQASIILDSQGQSPPISGPMLLFILGRIALSSGGLPYNRIETVTFIMGHAGVPAQTDCPQAELSRKSPAAITNVLSIVTHDRTVTPPRPFVFEITGESDHQPDCILQKGVVLAYLKTVVGPSGEFLWQVNNSVYS